MQAPTYTFISWSPRSSEFVQIASTVEKQRYNVEWKYMDVVLHDISIYRIDIECEPNTDSINE